MSLNSNIKEKLQIFEDLVNSSPSPHENSAKNNDLNEILSFLCSHKIQISIKYEKKCMFCSEKIDHNNKKSFINLTSCACENKFHLICFVEKIIEQKKNACSNFYLNKLMCFSCKTPISLEIFKEALGEKYFKKLQAEIITNKENKENHDQKFLSKQADNNFKKNYQISQETINKIGLKKCFNCGIIVYKCGGRKHFTCRCGAEFS